MPTAPEEITTPRTHVKKRDIHYRLKLVSMLAAIVWLLLFWIVSFTGWTYGNEAVREIGLAGMDISIGVQIGALLTSMGFYE